MMDYNRFRAPQGTQQPPFHQVGVLNAGDRQTGQLRDKINLLNSRFQGTEQSWPPPQHQSSAYSRTKDGISPVPCISGNQNFQQKGATHLPPQAFDVQTNNSIGGFPRHTYANQQMSRIMSPTSSVPQNYPPSFNPHEPQPPYQPQPIQNMVPQVPNMTQQHPGNTIPQSRMQMPRMLQNQQLPNSHTFPSNPPTPGHVNIPNPPRGEAASMRPFVAKPLAAKEEEPQHQLQFPDQPPQLQSRKAPNVGIIDMRSLAPQNRNAAHVSANSSAQCEDNPNLPFKGNGIPQVSPRQGRKMPWQPKNTQIQFPQIPQSTNFNAGNQNTFPPITSQYPTPNPYPIGDGSAQNPQQQFAAGRSISKDVLCIYGGNDLPLNAVYTDIINEDFFFPIDKSREREFLLRDGMFLIRPSSKENPLTLCYLKGQNIKHVPIRVRQDGKYELGKGEKTNVMGFDTVREIREHFCVHPIRLEDGTEIRLTSPAQRNQALYSFQYTG